MQISQVLDNEQQLLFLCSQTYTSHAYILVLQKCPPSSRHHILNVIIWSFWLEEELQGSPAKGLLLFSMHKIEFGPNILSSWFLSLCHIPTLQYDLKHKISGTEEESI